MITTRRTFLKSLASGLFVAVAPEVLLPERRFWQAGLNAPVGPRNRVLVASYASELNEGISQGETIEYEAAEDIHPGDLVVLGPNGLVRRAQIAMGASYPFVGVAIEQPRAVAYHTDRVLTLQEALSSASALGGRVLGVS